MKKLGYFILPFPVIGLMVFALSSSSRTWQRLMEVGWWNLYRWQYFPVIVVGLILIILCWSVLFEKQK